ncbi:TonB-dependent receptor [Marichromatium sp. AB32]|uniref:TonB-dependent receptor n=1 Tax=Marichromatium sp. AB32 TaxID=2483363 RepID=UPI000F3E54CF|nr:TonB-dependent receptor [Marichromatium sp. AB32]RNE93102.1 TonB-dependent receptor [Marichromatium sp. AB32]
MRYSNRRRRIAGAILGVSLPLQGLAADSDAVQLDTLTVTSRLSEESLAEIPFSVDVIDAGTLEEQRLLDLEEVLRQTPGVDVNSWGGANDANIRIRGVGSLYQVSAEDTSVVVNLDGVPMSSRHAAMATLDVERIEVLKGPQGTLFGRNSEAGALNVRSRRPTQEAEGYVRIEGGEDGQQLQEAAFGGALSEQWMARVAIRHEGADNWIENQRTGDPLTYRRGLAARASLLWEPSAATSLLLISERQQQDGYVSSILLRPYGDPPVVDLSPGAVDDNRKVVERHSLEFGQRLGWGQLTAISSLTSADIEVAKAYGTRVSEQVFGMPIEYVATDDGDERVFNQDLRLSSLPGAEVFWVAGLNLSRSRRTWDSASALEQTRYERRFDTHGEAIYGELTYPLADAWKLTAGWRHTWEEKRYGATYHRPTSTVSERRRLSDSYDTGRLALSHRLSESTNLYAVAARGYKSGGFNDFATQIADSEPYRAATVDSLEIGFKHHALDGRFDLSGALFYNRVADDHLLGFDYLTMATQAVNADTESQGAELEGNWRIGAGLSLTAGLSYTDATITEDVVGVQGGRVDAGNRVPDVARWSGLVSLSWQHALESFPGGAAPLLNARLTHRYVGERPADPQNRIDLDAYHKLDLRLGLMFGATEFYVWGDNLLDADYEHYAYWFPPDISVGLPAQGRVLGLGVSHLF